MFTNYTSAPQKLYNSPRNPLQPAESAYLCIGCVEIYTSYTLDGCDAHAQCGHAMHEILIVCNLLCLNLGVLHTHFKNAQVHPGVYLYCTITLALGVCVGATGRSRLKRSGPTSRNFLKLSSKHKHPSKQTRLIISCTCIHMFIHVYIRMCRIQLTQMYVHVHVFAQLTNA